MTRSERISLKMFEDSLLADNLRNVLLIDEYFWQDDPDYRPDMLEIAKAQALNADKTRFLLRYLKEFWGESDVT